MSNEYKKKRKVKDICVFVVFENHTGIGILLPPYNKIPVL
jgi:hypothetical protein